MKKLTCFMGAFLLCFLLQIVPPNILYGQTNYVLNSAFTKTSPQNQCPSFSFMNIDAIANNCWNWRAATNGTADYFGCFGYTPCTDTRVKDNMFGYEDDFNQDYMPTAGYAGFISYVAGDNYQEYVWGDLSPLTPGTYKVTFRISLAELSKYAVEGLGVYIGKDYRKVSTTRNLGFYDYYPQIIIDSAITSRTWVTLTGTYTAQGGENSIVIGAFYEVGGGTPVASSCNPNNWEYAYYFVDAVSIEKLGCTNCDDFITKLSSEDCCHKLSMNHTALECEVKEVRLVAKNGFLVDGKNGNQLNIQGISNGAPKSQLTWLNQSGASLHDSVKFCVDKNDVPDTVFVEYYTADGQLLCKDTLKIPDVYCKPDSYTIIPVKVEKEGSCCWKFDITANEGACPVSRIGANANRLLTLTEKLRAGDSLLGILEDCIPDSEALSTTTIRLYDEYGRTICQKEVPTPCEPKPRCCKPNTLDIEFEKNTTSTGFCCWRIKSITNKADGCKLYGFKILKGTQVLIDRATAYTANPPGPLLPGYSLSNQGGFCFNDAENTKGERTITIWMYTETGDSCSFEKTLCCDDACDAEWQNDIKLTTRKTSDINGNCCVDLYLENKRACALNIGPDAIDVGTYLYENECFIDGEWHMQPSSVNLPFSLKRNPSVLKPGLTYLGKLCKNAETFSSVKMWVGGIESGCSAEVEATVDCSQQPEECCEQLYSYMIPVESGECVCKFDIIVGQTPSLPCAVNSVRIINTGGGILQPVLFFPGPINFGEHTKIGSVCLNEIPGTGTFTFVSKVVVQFLDKDGNILCSQPLTQSCTRTFSGGGGGIYNGNKNDSSTLSVIGLLPSLLTTFNVMPNPASEKIQLHFGLKESGNVKLELVDINGKTELISQSYTIAGTHQAEHNVAGLPAGVYMLRLTYNETETATLKLVITR